MSYIWENFSKDTNYKIATEFCPYMEVYDNSESSFKSVNVLIRFYDIFQSLIHERQLKIENPEYIKSISLDNIENPIISFLADLDRLRGTHLKYIVDNLLINEINSNYFGERVRILFNKLNLKDKNVILDYILLKDISKDTNSYLEKVLLKLFSNDNNVARFYWHQSQNRFIMYSQLEETPYNLDMLELVKLLFADIDTIIQPVWKYHFGIVENNNTMLIDNIQLI